MHIFVVPSIEQVAIAGLVVTVLAALVVPAPRRWMATFWMQISGWLDAKLLRSHHEINVTIAVTKKIQGIKLRTEASFAHMLRAARPWFAKLAEAYNRALICWETAVERRAEEELIAAANGTTVEGNTAPIFSMNKEQYCALQTVIVLFDAGLTFLATETVGLPTWLLPLVVAGLGVMGAAFGHLLGQALYRRRRVAAAALVGLSLLYCGILAQMRYTYLQAEDPGQLSLGSLLMAYGCPLVAMGLSAFLGAQLRFLTPLEEARLYAVRAEKRCDRLDNRGRAAAKALRDAMDARKAYRTTFADAYRRGFSFGWSRREPLTFPDQEIDIPADQLWPPQRWTAAPPPEAYPRGTSGNNGAAKHLPALR